jgi:hypothetical protein
MKYTPLLTAALLAACSTSAPLVSEPMTPEQINARAAYLLDAEPHPLPTIQRYDWAAWDAREQTWHMVAYYDSATNTAHLSPAADEATLAHEIAHAYTISERAAECVAEAYAGDMGDGLNEYPRGWCR